MKPQEIILFLVAIGLIVLGAVSMSQPYNDFKAEWMEAE